ncbi:M60 family metallopeptidase [Pedobacter frigoris]|uniref:M60 family metallopeptidase n=1 Tax=Pedobacter frigoris TaxID=2571272 RepID=UPI002931152C|nr:M60 family metallopeptidase [Pedobacter frigoris]
MNHKIFNFLSIATLCAILLFGCKNQKLDPETRGKARPDALSASSNPNLNSTVGSNTQDFNELKDAIAERNRLALGNPWSDFDPTGFYLAPNTTMQISLQQLTGTARPKILVGTYSRYSVKNNPQEFTLTTGTNNITADQYGGLVWVRFGTTGTPSSSVRITFVSGHVRAPVFIKNQTTQTDWANQLSTYTASPDVILIGTRVYQVYSRTRALNTQTQDNNYVLSKADQTMDIEDAISGIDGSAVQHQPNINQRIIMTENDGTGWMFATYYRTAYVTAAASAAFTSTIGGVDGWGPWHELGHMHQQQAWKWSTLGEVTVNIYSLAVERAMGVTPSRLKRDNVWPAVSTYLANTSPAKDFNGTISNGEWIRLYMFHQLWLAFGDNFYKQLHKVTRVELPTVSTDAEKMRYFMLKACSVSGRNLTNFFRKWGFLVNESVYTEIAGLGLPQPTVEPSTLNEDVGIESGSTYKIISAVNNTSLLDVTASGTSNGTTVALYSNNNPSTLNQQWKVTSVGSGYYKLQPLHALTKVMDVTGAGTANGTQIQLYNDDSSAGQKWVIRSVGSGYYSLVPACAPDKQLDVNGGFSANGTKIQIWTTGTGNSQKFQFIKQ